MNRKEFLFSGLAAAGVTLASSIWNRLPAFLRPEEPAGFSVSASGQSPLPYAYDALEPHIDARTMEIHYAMHHAGYVANLIKAMQADPTLLLSPLADTLSKLGDLPEATRAAVRNHGGGHYNHSLFWHLLRPAKDAKPPSEAFAQRLTEAFGSVDGFREQFTKAALGHFGSGWVWLAQTAEGKLAITATANQDNPLMPDAPLRGQPLLGLDVWEHAYYLKHQNRRAAYVEAFWNLVHWPHVEALVRP